MKEAKETRSAADLLTRQDILQYGLSFPGTYQEAPFHDPNWQLVRVKGSKKVFLWTYEKDGFLNLNVKVKPEWRDFWRNAYAAVIPGYHQNKEHWNTIIVDGSIPVEEVRRMIAESYDLVTDSPAKRIYEAVRQVPKGKVATYGQIAELAGDKKMCRAVGNALHKIPTRNLPVLSHRKCQRGACRRFAFGGENAQADRLRADGIEVVDGRVDLEKYGIRVVDGRIVCEK